MFLLDMVLAQTFPQSRRSQTDTGIHLAHVGVRVPMLPQHRQTLQHTAHRGMSALHIKKNIQTHLNNPNRGDFSPPER